MIPGETLHFLRMLYRGQREGYLTLTAIHPSKKQPTPSRHLHITDKAGIHQALGDLLRINQLGWGAYFSVALRKEPLGRWHRGGQSDLLALTALYADLDGSLSESFERIHKSSLAGMPAPSAMVGSGRGLHLYWMIDPTNDFDRVNLVLAGLAQQLGGDTLTAHNAMRLPGSRNTKAGVNRTCKVLWVAPQRHYTLTDFTAFAKQPALQDTQQRWRAPPTLSDQINSDLIEAVVEVLLRDYSGFVQSNGWIGSQCPFPHSKDYPGSHFGFLPSKGVARCFGQHGQILLKELCTVIGIDPARYGGLYRKPKNKERKSHMAKQKSKTRETVILIRLPDSSARHGEATLTIQRGDLGHLHQFNYSGLTLRGNIAEAVQDALLALAKVEASPPPDMPTESPKAADDDSTSEIIANAEDTALEVESDLDEEDSAATSNEDNESDDTPPVEDEQEEIVPPSPAVPLTPENAAKLQMSLL